jgi:hypothetical protein
MTMKPETMLWSVLNSAMRPLAERAYRDLKDTERAATSTEETAPQFRAQLEQALQSPGGESTPPGPVAAAALGEGLDGVCRSARARAAWYFTLNLVLAIGMMVVFLGGAGGAVVAAFGWGANIWAAVFGGLSIVTAFALFITRPLQMVQVALLNMQRIDYLHLRYRQQLQDCSDLPTLQRRMDCRTQAWNAMKADLETIQK